MRDLYIKVTLKIYVINHTLMYIKCTLCILHWSKRIIIFQLVFHLRWMQFSQHSEAIPLYHSYSNPIGRAVEIPRMSIYMPSLHPAHLPGDRTDISAVNNKFNLLKNVNNYILPELTRNRSILLQICAHTFVIFTL